MLREYLPVPVLRTQNPGYRALILLSPAGEIKLLKAEEEPLPGKWSLAGVVRRAAVRQRLRLV